MRRLIAAAFACLLIAAPARAYNIPLPEPQTLTVDAGQAKRDFLVYAPASTSGPHPVVLVFHGGGGGAEWMANKTIISENSSQIRMIFK